MLRPWLHAGAGPLAAVVLLVLAGCGPSFVAEPDASVACEGVRCTAGTCVANGGQPMCRCGAWEAAAGLLCQVSSFTVPDDHAGSPDDATPLTVMSEPAEGRISASTRGQFDRDLFSFHPEPGHSYVFLCQPLSLPRCQPRLLDGSGRQLTGLFLDPERTAWSFKPRGEGPWYIEVSGAGDSGTYAYQLVDLGADDHEDSRDQAAVMEPSDANFTVTSDFLGDDDVIRFQAKAGHAYRMGCELPSTQVGVALRLLDASGRVVDTGEALGTRRMPEVELQAPAAGTWFMQVSPTFGPMPISVTCWLKDLGADDHGDVLATATRLTPGERAPVRLQTRKDVDVLRFTAEAGHTYVLRQSPHVIASIQLHDARDTQLRSANPQWYLLESAIAGDYFLKVRPPAIGALEPPFELWVEDLGPDDHGDTQATATRLSPGVPVEARPHGNSDSDTFAIDVEEQGVYTVRCEPACQARIEGPYQGRYMSRQELREVLLDVSGSGTLYLSLMPSRALDPFTVTVTRTRSDGHPDSVTADTPVRAPPLHVTGDFEAEGDRDALAVTLEAGAWYLVAPSDNAQVSILNPYGSASWFPSQGIYVAPVTGRYSVVLTHRLSWRTDWSLMLERR
ncbi:hypothetical protein HPC49_01880 [Pyxidicoccus fallax]|uniref:Lipoprotein n=1 Tax=Pyxidicoccus fallax TaxID=394095 RepID=A0A848L6A7_9BACT|nr:hypothetical protein [Pyxidicoccus fallax]NMO13812.1 hypothetical protein [Pyxidicoccus fallax]NPC77001.1 hypothetical protein [Pyxidicoccus fallax]